MHVPRRRFLRLAAGAATATTLPPTTVPAQVRAQSAAILPKRSARDRLEQALARIADPNGEGARACLTVYAETARAAADAADARARAGISLGPLDGTIVSIKDLFDVAGEPTRAGTKVLADAPPALADAQVVRRLRAAGGVIVAKTNMPEFAFASFGRNPHYGTPGNPSDRSRDPGGSSSGRPLRLRMACARSPSAATLADRFEGLRHSAVWSASSPPSHACRWKGWCSSLLAWTLLGRWRGVLRIAWQPTRSCRGKRFERLSQRRSRDYDSPFPRPWRKVWMRR